MRPIPDSVVALGTTSEGLRLKAYMDSAGIWTIGYGHKIVPGDHYDQHSVITLQQARDLYKANVAVAAAQVLHLVRVPLNDNEFAALVDFTYNLGSGSLAGSTLLKKLNSGDRIGAAAEFASWNKAKNKQTGNLEILSGLTIRRAKEAQLFLAPVI